MFTRLDIGLITGVRIAVIGVVIGDKILLQRFGRKLSGFERGFEIKVRMDEERVEIKVEIGVIIDDVIVINVDEGEDTK
ncbi:hypothetical protein, partial [Staphylococcus saprophyticus]|uniref:hypothetical protein n=1 Tax=Staphylococcus saprophyticus TaxID=29385 RepID=UPI00119EF8A8